MKSAFLMAALFGINTSAFAEEVQPYLDSLKTKHDIPPKVQIEDVPPSTRPPVDDNKEPYIQSLRQKSKDLELELQNEENPPEESSVVGRKSSVQPYIESLKAGKELKEKKRGIVKHAAGIAVVTQGQFKVTADQSANSFDSVYDTKNRYNPSAFLFYEYQLVRSRYFGVLGILGKAGVIATKGQGRFTKSQTVSEDVIFRFTAAPVSVGLRYRLNQLRYVAPYAGIGVMAVPFYETRNDNQSPRKGISRGYETSLGVSINLDWIGRSNAWEQYDSNGIFHTYLFAEWQYLRSVSSRVSFNHNGLYAGLMFEF